MNASVAEYYTVTLTSDECLGIDITPGELAYERAQKYAKTVGKTVVPEDYVLNINIDSTYSVRFKLVSEKGEQ